MLTSGFIAFAGLLAAPPAAAWTLHPPIVINGNAEFTGANGVTGGSGTPGDPYVIEGWEIDGSANSCIEVYNTDAHFVIRDVYLHSALIDAIFFDTVRNATVANATVTGNDAGLYLQSSSDLTVTANNISMNTLDAIVLDFSDNVTVEGNEMWGNGDWGVFTYESDDLVIRNNTIGGNGQAGVELDWSDRVVLSGNQIVNNTIAGVVTNTAVDATVEKNNITGNGVGAQAIATVGLLVRNNVLDANIPQAADDAGAVNAWDDSYPTGGNYWSDYGGVDNCSGPNQNVCPFPDGIGDTSYVIDGDTQDRYPLMQPFVTGSAQYTVTVIPPLIGDLYTIPWGINETGAVVGWSTDGGFERPFLYTDAGGTVPLPFAPNTTRGSARDISDTGVIVGDLYSPNQSHAMRWPPGGPPEDLGTMGGPTSAALGVNETGAVTGRSDYGGPLPKAFLYTDATGFIDVDPFASGTAADVNDGGVAVGFAAGGTFRWSEGDLEVLGGAFGLDMSRGRAINQMGQIGGCLWDVTPDVEQAARYTDGIGWEPLGPVSDTNCGYGINAYGDVVGTGRPTGVGIVRAFLYTDAGGMQDLELMTNRTPTVRLLAANAINDAGQIVGYAWDNSIPQYIGYRLEPTVPPPPNAGPTVTVISPNGGEFWGSGTSRLFEWRMTDREDGVLDVTADLSVDGGLTFPYPLFSGPLGQGTRARLWTLPGVITSQAVVRICASDSQSLSACDVSDGAFTIDPGALVITMDTSPTGFLVLVDGANRTAPYSLSCAPSSTHSVEVAPTQPINQFSRYGFTNWSDGGTLAHVITCDVNRTVTASYQREWWVDLDTNPIGLDLLYDGVLQTTPLRLWCADGSAHTLEAPSPNGGGPDVRYVFDRWMEDASTMNPRTHTCNGATPYTAEYLTEYRLTLDTSPTGLEVTLDGAPLTAPTTTWCPDLSVHTIGAPSPQFLGGDRYDFSTWSDTGAQTHPIMCTGPSTITASFLGPFPSAPSVSVTSPNGGEVWSGGSSQPVAWAMDDPDDGALNVTVDLSVDGGATFPYPLAFGSLPLGSHSIPATMPLVDTTTARVRVCVVDPNSLSACDTSDADFAIDSTPPSVASVAPGDGAVNVGLNEDVVVTFSEAMAAATFPVPGISLSPAVGALLTSWSSGGLVLTAVHGGFAPCTTYAATVDAGGLDLSQPGNSLAAPFTWSFSTACPPSVELLEPVGGEDWTGGSTHAVRFRVADDLDAQLLVWVNVTVDSVAVPLYFGMVPVGDNEVPWTLPSSTSSAEVTVAAMDSAGLDTAAISATFGIDAQLPTLLMTDPADGAADVSLDSRIHLTFSEPMDLASVEQAVAVSPAPSTPSFSWDASGTFLTIQFDASLEEFTDYLVTIGCGAHDDSDPGNAMEGCPGSASEVGFRTEIVTPPPVAGATSPSDVRVGAPVTFDGRGSTGAIATWTWTVATETGNVRATLDGEVAEHTFTEPGPYVVTLRVEDAFGRTDEYTLSLSVAGGSEPGGEIPWIYVALAAGAAAAILFAASEPGRVAIATATTGRLYGRKPKKDEDSEIRGAIHYYVRVHPGDSYMDIKRNLGLNDGVVTYHLARLEKDKLIKSAIRGARKRYFPADARIPLENGGELHEIQQRILRIVAMQPGMPVSLLAEQLGVSTQLALYHLRQLARSDRVNLSRRGLRLVARAGSSEH